MIKKNTLLGITAHHATFEINKQTTNLLCLGQTIAEVVEDRTMQLPTSLPALLQLFWNGELPFQPDEFWLNGLGKKRTP